MRLILIHRLMIPPESDDHNRDSIIVAEPVSDTEHIMPLLTAEQEQVTKFTPKCKSCNHACFKDAGALAGRVSFTHTQAFTVRFNSWTTGVR